MEDEVKKEIPKLKIKRKVSFFRKRKKLEVRAFAKETKNRQFNKTFLKILGVIFLVFIFSGLLWALRFYVIPKFINSQNTKIISPINETLSADKIKEKVLNSGFDIDNLKISNDLSIATFQIHREIQVIIDPRKDIKESLTLLKAIDSQMIEANKRAIYIDLRYNKPIVNF